MMGNPLNMVRPYLLWRNINMALKRILIANRGEIVLRAIRTIKEMGKESIVVHSTADRHAGYLDLADAHVCIGGDRSIDSYLKIPAIITAAEIFNADAVFPGYGFLSENATFVEICKHHGLTFIGPSGNVMNAMGNKSQAKEVMRQAGIPVIPGSDAPLRDIDDAKKQAKNIGYPIILKAASGGGGRGMRIVDDEQRMQNAFLAAESEAISAFGDGTIYMEKFIDKPRHIEVQILADQHGNVVHLGERDCSMQRRHQKLIEESPALFLSEETRHKLHETAVRATQSIQYVGAGTFEFLVDQNQNFYFMEMNTRLQVEHTVSEMVSDIDIVEWMIRIAEGERLFDQSAINLKGHSIECRITAEDPNSFLPCPGTITSWRVPDGKGVRVDSHVYSGYRVPPYYDSMIGKLIVHGINRDHAIRRMSRALHEFKVEGIQTTIPFHQAMMQNSDFKENCFHTKYLEQKML
jgi:acetyl-CoA carboxylase, biotin carboxylase subunit